MMRIHRRATVCLAVFVTLMPLTACHSWRQQHTADSAPLVQYERPVRLTLRDGGRIELMSARISGDSVYGTLQKGTADARATSVSLPLRDVQRLDERQFSTGKTIGVVGASLAALWVAAGLALMAAGPALLYG